MNIQMGISCYWRFKGEKAYRYGFPLPAGKGLISMGRYNGDGNGILVGPYDIEIRQ
jgi:hypothetical protein